MMLRKVNGFEKYLVSDDGRVFSTYKGGKELKQKINIFGYHSVTLYDENAKPHNKAVHRLVAEAFLENSDNLPQVNHKDECKSNNNVSNLEWCSCSYNINYGSRNEIVSKKQKENKLRTTARKVAQIDIHTGEIIKVWESVRAPEYELGIAHQNIIACCKGKRKSRGGYIWQYLSA